jgi:hypothetical protein
MTTEATPGALGSNAQLGLDPERVAFERWLNPGQHAGNVSPWVEPGRYEKDTHSLAWLAWKAAAGSTRANCAETIEVLVCTCCHTEAEVEFARYLADEIRGDS